jgi:hypothetical protein
MLLQGFYQIVRGGYPPENLRDIPDGRLLSKIRAGITTGVAYQDGKVLMEKSVA